MKRIIALTLLILFGCSVAYCGDGDGEHFRRVYFGLSVTPDVSYRYLINNYIAPGNSSSTNQNIIATENHQASPQFGINAQVKVGVNLTHWLAVESGVGYMLAQYKYQASGPGFIPSFSSTMPVLSDSVNLKQKENYQYMTVPIGLRFSMGHRKVRGIIAAGVNLDFLLKQKEVTILSDASGTISSTTTVDQTKNFHTFNVSPYLGVGIDCHISPAFVLRLMPEAQIQALKNINEPISEYLWNVGFNVSFLFGL
jgi:hypothetical protein